MPVNLSSAKTQSQGLNALPVVLYAQAQDNAFYSVGLQATGDESALLTSTVGSQLSTLQQDPTTFDLLVQEQFGGVNIDPRAIRALATTDKVTVYGSAGLALQQDASNSSKVALQTAAGVAYDARKTDPGITTVFVEGTATHPASGAAITNVLTPAAGSYQLSVTAGVFGAFGFSDLDNMQLFKNASSITPIPAPLGSSILSGPWKASANGTDTFTIKAGGLASTVGSFYQAFIAMVQMS